MWGGGLLMGLQLAKSKFSLPDKYCELIAISPPQSPAVIKGHVIEASPIVQLEQMVPNDWQSQVIWRQI